MNAGNIPPAGEPATNEVAFLHVRTSAGVICVNTHNDHNGYYGGIEITVEEVS